MCVSYWEINRFLLRTLLCAEVVLAMPWKLPDPLFQCLRVTQGAIQTSGVFCLKKPHPSVFSCYPLVQHTLDLEKPGKFMS